MSGDSCIWSGTDYTSNDPVDKTVTVNFYDSETAMQFYDSCEVRTLNPMNKAPRFATFSVIFDFLLLQLQTIMSNAIRLFSFEIPIFRHCCKSHLHFIANHTFRSLLIRFLTCYNIVSRLLHTMPAARPPGVTQSRAQGINGPPAHYAGATKYHFYCINNNALFQLPPYQTSPNLCVGRHVIRCVYCFRRVKPLRTRPQIPSRRNILFKRLNKYLTSTVD